MKESASNSYKQIIKATSIFGGAQVVQIVFAVIRSKAVALLLGPFGMGIMGLLSSSIELIGLVSSFGLRTSAVRNIASASTSEDTSRVSLNVIVLRRWVWITGLLGATTTILISSWLSEIAFGNKSYATAIVWISVTLLINQISSGQNVVLQGLRMIKQLSLAGIYGSFLGLIISVPLFYYFGIDGIVPSIILTSISNMALSYYYSSKIKIDRLRVSFADTFNIGKEMIKLGFVLSLSGLMVALASYLLKIFIGSVGTVDQIGLYNAGFAIITTYVGMIFTAMATDYYPRLSSIIDDKVKSEDLINQQGEIAILILGPILAIFIIFIRFVIILLYSEKFVDVVVMVQFAAIGIYFKAATWSIGFMLISKSDTKSFFWNELILNCYGLLLNILGYYFYGLLGLGISFALMYALYFVQIYAVCRLKYGFIFKRNFLIILSIQLLFGIGCLIIKLCSTEYYSYILGSVVCLASLLYSIYILNKIIPLTNLLSKIKK